MVQNKDGFIELDLPVVLNALLRKAWLIILCIVLFAVGGFCYAFYFIAPTYKANVMFYVNGNTYAGLNATKLNISSADISVARTLVDTYRVILKTRNTLNEVIEESGENLDYSSLYGMVNASAVDDTEVFQVTVTSSDPLQAEHLANTIADVLPKKIASIVEGSSARVVDYAVIPVSKSAPDLKKYTLNGALIGLVFAAAVIIIMLLLDYQIHDEEYLVNTYPEIPILGVIPDFNTRRVYGKYIRRTGYGNRYDSSYYNTDKEETDDTKTDEAKTEDTDVKTENSGQPREVVRRPGSKR